ncbi:MAG: hypothetical protein IJV00_07135 [Clostridia bacterium]|nr:hypothetical protein [Clostridia bacterium]
MKTFYKTFLDLYFGGDKKIEKRQNPALTERCFIRIAGDAARRSKEEDEKLICAISEALSRFELDIIDEAPQKPEKRKRQYVIAAVENADGTVSAALYEKKAFLSGKRETRLDFPSQVCKNKGSSICSITALFRTIP